MRTRARTDLCGAIRDGRPYRNNTSPCLIDAPLESERVGLCTSFTERVYAECLEAKGQKAPILRTFLCASFPPGESEKNVLSKIFSPFFLFSSSLISKGIKIVSYFSRQEVPSK